MERGTAAARQQVDFHCSKQHHLTLTFAAEAVVPDVWDCPKCGLPASQDQANPPSAPSHEPYKTHLAYAKERRSDEEAEAILDEAIKVLRSRRRSGDVGFF